MSNEERLADKPEEARSTTIGVKVALGQEIRGSGRGTKMTNTLRRSKIQKSGQRILAGPKKESDPVTISPTSGRADQLVSDRIPGEPSHYFGSGLLLCYL